MSIHHLNDMVFQVSRDLSSLVGEEPYMPILLLILATVTPFLVNHLGLYWLWLRESSLWIYLVSPLPKQFWPLALGDVEVGVFIEPPSDIPLSSVILNSSSIGMDISTVGQSSLLHLICGLPLAKSVVRSKLELKSFILHLGFWYILPPEKTYLLNDTDFDHSLVPHLEYSLLPHYIVLFFTEFFDDLEEGEEHFLELHVSEILTLYAFSLHIFLALF